MKKKGNFLTGLIAGIAAGAAAALLLTPKKGQEAREIITERASDIRDRAGDIRERASGQVSSLRDRVRRGGSRQDVDESGADAANNSPNGPAETE